MITTEPAVLQQLPLEKIQPSPYQARKDFTPEDLQDLANSMKEEGLLQPVLVRRSDRKSTRLNSSH